MGADGSAMIRTHHEIMEEKMEAKPCQNFVEPLLKPTQAAELLGINHHTLDRMARDHAVPAIKVGKLWRYRRSDLEAWVESKVNEKRTIGHK
jgi:excisionase family DNA binding protein